MPKMPKIRKGTDLEVKRVPVGFSYWPARQPKRNKTLQFELFTTSAWPVIEGTINTKCPKESMSSANAFLVQSEDFYRASFNSGISTKPVLLYYSFLNLVKAFILTKGQASSLDRAKHGLSEKLEEGGKEIKNAYLLAFKSSPSERNIYDEFITTLGFSGLSNNKAIYPVEHILSQVAAAHRLWKEASHRAERFIPVHELRFRNNPENLDIWINLYILQDDLSRFSISHNKLLEESRLKNKFRYVDNKSGNFGKDHRKLLCLELKNPLRYKKRPLDKIGMLIEEISIRDKLWLIATSIPPYRKYYIYMKPMDEIVLPQLGSMYALFYYLGSVARYRPSLYTKLILGGNYGAFISEFLSSQPEQFLYLLASEFAQRQVVKPAII